MARPLRRAPARSGNARAPRKARGGKRADHQHPELLGLTLVALGAFFAVVLWFGLEGGEIGERVGRSLRVLVGQGAVLVPAALLLVGGLLLGRSRLIDL